MIRPARWKRLFPVLGLLGAGCATTAPQSMLAPADEAASHIAALWWLMFGVLGAVTIAVFLLTALAVWRRPAEAPPGGHTRFVVIGGIALPAVVSTGFLIASLDTTVAIQAPETELTIAITGYQWWWEVRYPDAGVVSANEVHVPAGVPVKLVLRSADVIHSFWVPRLAGKMDMLPEHPTEFWVRAAEPGVYRGQCAEFCGAQHAHMALYVVALPPAEFETWLAAKKASAPEAGEAAAGKAVFFGSSCHSCHAIGGTQAQGRLGPDLTHVGSRLSLGAGAVAHTPETMASWITNAPAIKPGVRMPAYPGLAAGELAALVDYMESLR